MFKFGKKNEEITEQVMEEVSDEQLNQVSGGSLLNAINLDGATDYAQGRSTSLVSEVVSSIGVSGIQVQGAGASVTTPAIVPGTLLQ